jgi:uracil-DNA glycosylase
MTNRGNEELSARLASLRQRMLACRRCLEEGYEIVPPAVFSGPATAGAMVIGQAPGITEQETGRPMNAGSGRRLFTWLGEAGWDEDDFRARHYMTAVTRCYPGRHSSGRGDRVPTSTEQALCRPFLEEEITLVNPRLLIPVGGLAIKLFYPNRTLLKDVVGTAAYFPPSTLATPVNFDLDDARLLQGFDSRLDPAGRWVVPLPHPSGASLWPNRPQNKALIARAVEILSAIREAWGL